MTEAHPRAFKMQRRQFIKAGSVLAAASFVPGIAAAQDRTKKYAGLTLNVSTFSAAYPKYLQQWLPEFEARTGAKVNFDTPSFPVYNQRADLELSTKGSAYDVVNVTFIYSSRWINSGWLTPLDDYIHNPNLTSADWNVRDFLPGALHRRPVEMASCTASPGLLKRCSPAPRVSISSRPQDFGSPTRPTILSRCCAPST